MNTPIIRRSVSSFFVALCLLLPGQVKAQFYARDDAGGYTNPPGNYAWLFNATTNGGFGFTPWSFARGGSGFQGYFIGGDSIATTNGKAWGMYANGSGADNVAVAYRGFTNSLPTNSVFKIKWHALGIGFSSTQRAGFSLRNGNANASTNDFDTGARFDFFYMGGDADAFLFSDGNGVNFTSLGFGSGPFEIDFTLLTADTYRLVIKDAAGVNTLATFDSLPLAGSGTIDSVALYALQTDNNQIWNNLEISSVSLVPPDIANITPTNNSIYVDPATAVSFDVNSFFSTVATNGIKLALNGINQTNLTFTGTPTNRHVVLNTALLPNLVYNGVVTAQDANGNKATNTFTFNTWASSVPFIEAEDYNYSSGGFIPPPNSFPDAFDAYANQIGSNGVDYLEYDLAGTNNIYRPGDLPQVEIATDVDHADYATFGYTDYTLAFIKNGEWENYTRVMTNVAYDVYARMAGFGDSATMLLEHLATATATSSNQPRASLGTFVCPNTGGAQNWTFVSLKDFFSTPVQVRFSGTNTFRATCLGADGNYNFSYLIFVPSTNTATLRPYISSGFPYSGANVFPDQLINVNIANRQTAVSPGTIQLTLNGTNVTPGTVVSNNAAGATLSYQPSSLLPAGTNTIRMVFGDGTVLQTNQWQFVVVTLPVIPSSFALASSLAGSPGFAVQIAKAPDTATNTDFPPTVARVLLHLAGRITNSATGRPYPNLAAGPNNDGLFNETNAINYDINATAAGNSTFSFKTNFPYVPASGTNNFISMAANLYALLTPGVWTFAVRSDDGFQVTTGPAPAATNLTLGIFDAGRGNDETAFSFIVQTNGLYPMRLLYDQSEFGGNIEFYSKKNGQSILLNDLSNPNSVKVYRTVRGTLTILNPSHTGNQTRFSFLTEAGKTHVVEYKNTLTDPVWQTLTTISGNGSITNVVDNTASPAVRFYRVNTH